MEKAMSNDREDYIYEYTLERDIRLAYQLCPDVIKPLMQRISEVHNNKLINKRIRCKLPLNIRMSVARRLNKNIDSIHNVHSRVQKYMLDDISM